MTTNQGYSSLKKQKTKKKPKKTNEIVQCWMGVKTKHFDFETVNFFSKLIMLYIKAEAIQRWRRNRIVNLIIINIFL